MARRTFSKENLTERQVDLRIRREVLSLGGYYIKLETNLHAGLPDRMILLPHGIVIFCEVKRPGETPSSLQLAVSKEFTSREIPWIWADSLEMFRDKIKNLLSDEKP